MKYAPYSLLLLMSVPICLLGVLLVWPPKEAPSVETPVKFYSHRASIADTVDDDIHDARVMTVNGEPSASVLPLPYRQVKGYLRPGVGTCSRPTDCSPSISFANSLSSLSGVMPS